MLWQTVLQRYPATSRPNSVVEFLGNAGGYSGSSLWRFESSQGRLVLRCWPADGPDRARLEQIHAWLAIARPLGFVPGPLETLDRQTIVTAGGRLWELAPWMPGQADRSRPPPAERIRKVFAGLAAFLWRLGGVCSHASSPGLAARVDEIDRLISGEFAAMRGRFERSSSDALSILAQRWLDRAIDLAPGVLGSLRQAAGLALPLQPCLRDARPDHFLFEGDELSGLVDFGAMGRDTVSGDLARLLAEGVGPDRLARLEALSAFESVRRLSESELRAIPLFEQANALLGPARWVRWHFFEGRWFEDPDAVARGLRRGLERLEETFGIKIHP